jgi:hypothetical protein
MDRSKLGALTQLARRIPNPIRAYHGTPHKFDEFDISKIGTGEGAQAYGHGLYFAEREPVARGYRDRLSALSVDPIVIDGSSYDPLSMKSYKKNPSSLDHDIKRYQNTLDEYNKINAELPMNPRIIKSLETKLHDLIKLKNYNFDEINFHPGHMYEVNLHVPRESLLDWGKPLEQQAEYVRNALSALDPYVASSGEKVWKELSRPALASTPTGSPKEAAAWLMEQGIPGIQYLEATARATS